MAGNVATESHRDVSGAGMVIGQLNIMQTSTAPTPTVFDFLKPFFAQDALYNSVKREAEYAVTCLPKTRTKTLEEVRSWADSSTLPSICWLSGPAGTGKTTVAHTIAKEYAERGSLAATFFFWRKTGDRDDINKLVATLAWQIADNIPSAKNQIEKALKGDNRLSSLFGHPLSRLSLNDKLSIFLLVREPIADRKLVVIDGLDECSSQQGICRLIEWLRENKPPFRFLLTSRPEHQIKTCFQCVRDTAVGVHPLLLRESEDDVRTYFVQELEKVRQERLAGCAVSPGCLWDSSIDKLVEKSQGLFIYAATAVRYILRQGSSITRLEKVLNLHNGLDPLYAQVVEDAKEWDYFDIVMGSLMYLRYPLGIDELCKILHASGRRLGIHEIRNALAGCHSILRIPEDGAEDIGFCHPSLRDFLTDEHRSKELFYAPARCHGQLMVNCLKAIDGASGFDGCPEYALISWYYHGCQFLSTTAANDGLEGLKDEAQELVKKIGVKWVRSWMREALCWAGAPYLRGGIPLHEGHKGSTNTHWTGPMASKMRSIAGILEEVRMHDGLQI
ncbi:hypothetical protein EDC04DRAFT_2653553 [Pisolithus marmoratus]|nr:hypothetical protein EDC04DRAFT_2653553 [Pisolithus marmoratus]